jgi:hypothetical protein
MGLQMKPNGQTPCSVLMIDISLGVVKGCGTMHALGLSDDDCLVRLACYSSCIGELQRVRWTRQMYQADGPCALWYVPFTSSTRDCIFCSCVLEFGRSSNCLEKLMLAISTRVPPYSEARICSLWTETDACSTDLLRSMLKAGNCIKGRGLASPLHPYIALGLSTAGLLCLIQEG